MVVLGCLECVEKTATLVLYVDGLGLNGYFRALVRIYGASKTHSTIISFLIQNQLNLTICHIFPVHLENLTFVFPYSS